MDRLYSPRSVNISGRQGRADWSGAMTDLPNLGPELPARIWIACGLMLAAVLTYCGFEHSRPLGWVSLAFCGVILLAFVGLAIVRSRHGGDGGIGDHVD
jgi:hypothetical protein